LLLADQLIDKSPEAAAAPPQPTRPDPALILRAETLADRLESLALALENEGVNP
jgi:cell division protein ZapA